MPVRQQVLFSVCGVLVLGAVALSDPVAKTETFDSEASAAANGWVGHNNRGDYDGTGGPQNIGWDSGSGGRAGGPTRNKSTGGAATAYDSYCYYADVFPVPLTWNDDFSASGTYTRNGTDNDGCFLGFFNTDDPGGSGQASCIGINLGDDGGRFNIKHRADNETVTPWTGGDWRPGLFGTFTLTYEASLRKISLTMNGQTKTAFISDPTTVNAFGWIFPSCPTCTFTPDGTDFYFDNLQYSGAVAGNAKITFDLESSGSLETVSPALMAVNLIDANPAETYTVDYSVDDANSSATEGDDYTLVTPQTLTFGPGETTETIVIDINDDGTDEEDETIVLKLSNPTGGAVLVEKGVYAGSEHTYTIIDPRPKISFAAESSSGPESVTPALIEVTVSKDFAETLTVDYEVTARTAVAGVEYNLPPGTLTFDPHDTSEYISLEVVDDSIPQVDPIRDETIVITLSNPTGTCTLGGIKDHTYTILEDDPGVLWDDKLWTIDTDPSRLFINSDFDLEWTPVAGDQYTAHIPEQAFSQAGQVVEISYIFMSDGQHICLDCFSCDLYCFDDDITCIAGTSDIRVGLYDWVGQTVGTKGYNFRFGPNMIAGPTRWVEDCRGGEETHKTGNFAKKPAGSSSLQSDNEGLMDYIPGFELTPGDYSLFAVRLQRNSSSSVTLSITLNDRTYSMTDSSSTDQPQKINYFAVSMRNSRPYSRLVLRSTVECPGDFYRDFTVDEKDLKVIGDDWLLQGTTELRGTAPDGSGLILHYAFEGTSGQDITSVPELSGSGVGSLTRFSEASAGDLEYGQSNPWTASGTSADFQNPSADPGTALYADHHSLLNLNLGEFTISAFVKPRSIRQSVIIRKRDGGTGEWYLDLRPDGRIGFTAHDDDHVMFSSAAVQANDWYHVAGVFDEDAADGKPMKLYINGALSNHATYTLRPASTTEPLGVGCIIRGSTSNTGQFFDGLIDELKIYDYALSEDEIVYEANNGPTIIYTPPDSVANMVPDEVINLKDFVEFAGHWLSSCD